jgi:hypothetical protein
MLSPELPKFKRRWLVLATSIISVTLALSVVLSRIWVQMRTPQVMQQRASLAIIQKLGGICGYGGHTHPVTESLLAPFLDEDYFRDVSSVSLANSPVTDVDLQ